MNDCLEKLTKEIFHQDFDFFFYTLYINMIKSYECEKSIYDTLQSNQISIKLFENISKDVKSQKNFIDEFNDLKIVFNNLCNFENKIFLRFYKFFSKNTKNNNKHKFHKNFYNSFIIKHNILIINSLLILNFT